jgi:hypothetical protein
MFGAVICAVAVFSVVVTAEAVAVVVAARDSPERECIARRG